MLAMVLDSGDEIRSAVDIYHEEEHRNIIMKCLFPVGTDKPPRSLLIDLMKEPLRRIYLYDSRHEAEPYIDEFYKGRLHCDPSFIPDERIKCHLTDLTLNDTGTYRFVVVADRKSISKAFNLEVTASKYETPEDFSTPMTGGRVWLYVSFGMFVFVLVGLVVRYFMSKRNKIRFTNDKLFDKNSSVK